jgi:hypothetical protein
MVLSDARSSAAICLETWPGPELISGQTVDCRSRNAMENAYHFWIEEMLSSAADVASCGLSDLMA